MARTELHFTDQPLAATDFDTFVICGTKANLSGPKVLAALPESARGLWPAMVDSLSAGDTAASTSTWLDGDARPKKLVAIAISSRATRHNSPGRPDVIGGAVAGRSAKGKTGVVIALSDPDHAFAAGCSVARGFPEYSRKTRPSDGKTRHVQVALMAKDGALQPVDRITAVADGIRLAARLVDMPPSELTTDQFVTEARAVATAVGAECNVIDYDALLEGGFGGLVGVGKAAVHKPALVHLVHDPEGATQRLAWVGKGIVYDTGGLSIKTKTGMPGMKTDMGGAAAVLGAFQAAVTAKIAARIDAILCLAENSVGPEATRPDDILSLYSGKTVEVNNTDAEGRLVLGDGVAYATKHLSPDVVVDLATLTGAQLIATGKHHAAIVTNDEGLETRAVASGRRCGDLVHPLPYAPEFFQSEFKSKVADLKNSVKDRMNAQSSCAGQFVAEHLVDFKGAWLHVDLAGPSARKERGTGFGVALLIDLFSER